MGLRHPCGGIAPIRHYSQLGVWRPCFRSSRGVSLGDLGMRWLHRLVRSWSPLPTVDRLRHPVIRYHQRDFLHS